MTSRPTGAILWAVLKRTKVHKGTQSLLGSGLCYIFRFYAALFMNIFGSIEQTPWGFLLLSTRCGVERPTPQQILLSHFNPLYPLFYPASISFPSFTTTVPSSAIVQSPTGRSKWPWVYRPANSLAPVEKRKFPAYARNSVPLFSWRPNIANAS